MDTTDGELKGHVNIRILKGMTKIASTDLKTGSRRPGSSLFSSSSGAERGFSSLSFSTGFSCTFA
jgi:hypothetical protein